MTTPGNLDSDIYKTNQNENLICLENQNSLNIENPYIINVEDKNNSFEIYKGKACFWLMIMFMIFIPPLFPILIISLFFLEKKIEITKNEKLGEIEVIKKNYCNCTKRINFSIENCAFEVRRGGTQEYCGQEHEMINIIIYNTSPKEIDLDNSDFKNVPFKSIHKFKDYLGKQQEINLKLSKYINKTFYNKIDDELKQYVPNFESNNKNNFFPFMPIQKSYIRIIKISDHYYIYNTYNYDLETDYKENFKE